MGSRLRLCLVWCAAVLGASACAAHQPSRLTDRFVRQGEPSVDLGGQLPGGETQQYIEQVRKVAAEAKPRPKSESPAIAETFDPILKQRLADLQAAPTAAAHEAVAAEYRRLGILDLAFRHLSSAIRLAPKDASLYDQRARIWRAWSFPGLGVRDARKAVGLAPRAATAWNTLGLLLEGSGRSTDALKAYRRATFLDVHAAYAWNNLCRAWTTGRQARAAVEACGQALTLDPSLRQAALNLHLAERQLGGDTPGTRPVDITAARR